MSFEPRDYLQHILIEIEYLLESSGDLEFDEFSADETRRRAFVRSLEIIGEAANRIPVEMRREYADVEWDGMRGMRNRLIHGYFGVDYEIVWDVVQNRIPDLRKQITAILDE